MLYFTRPLAEKKLKIGHEKNNIEQLIDKTCLVTSVIKTISAGPGKTGRPDLDAAAVNENRETLEKGELVRIVRIEGVKLIVERQRQSAD